MLFTRRQALKSENDIIFEFLKESAVWLNEKGIDYWQNWLNPTDDDISWITEGIDNSQFYLVETETDLIGMYRLQFEDELFWGNKVDKAGYIHSFATKRTLKGEGIGSKILEHIEEELKLKSYEYLRLDCGLAVKGLCRFYESYGFESVGQIVLRGEELILYEKTL